MNSMEYTECEIIRKRIESLTADIDLGMCLGQTLREVFECPREHLMISTLSDRYRALECDRVYGAADHHPHIVKKQ